ncbi:MAG: hypothetical protein M1819_003229 [Sarea resinae]|nr:MAG: hypothetical protein M1819_003229 [Sarea resinae]
MSPAIQDLQILHLEADDEGPSYYRVLVSGKDVKYISIDPHIYNMEDLVFPTTLIPQLPVFPPDDLPSIRNVWHSVKVDHRCLTLAEYNGDGENTSFNTNTHAATVDQTTSASLSLPRNVVAKFANFTWEVEYYAQETTIYQRLEATAAVASQPRKIAPQFLGHITEENGKRVIGFLLEKIEGGRFPDGAVVKDLERCRDLVGRLHGLGILHGDLNRFNFLLVNDVNEGRDVLLDFESARIGAEQWEMEEEMGGLEAKLMDEEGLGGVEEWVGELKY